MLGAKHSSNINHNLIETFLLIAFLAVTIIVVIKRRRGRGSLHISALMFLLDDSDHLDMKARFLFITPLQLTTAVASRHYSFIELMIKTHHEIGNRNICLSIYIYINEFVSMCKCWKSN